MAWIASQIYPVVINCLAVIAPFPVQSAEIKRQSFEFVAALQKKIKRLQGSEAGFRLLQIIEAAAQIELRDWIIRLLRQRALCILPGFPPLAVRRAEQR